MTCVVAKGLIGCVLFVCKDTFSGYLWVSLFWSVIRKDEADVLLSLVEICIFAGLALIFHVHNIIKV